jgi:hypothetical protein
MGEPTYFLWLGIWGNTDQRTSTIDDFESIVLYADGESITLEAEGWTVGAIGASQRVYVKPVASATDAYYRVTFDQLRLIAEASDIRIRAGRIEPLQYTPWAAYADSKSALVEFIRHVN